MSYLRRCLAWPAAKVTGGRFTTGSIIKQQMKHKSSQDAIGAPGDFGKPSEDFSSGTNWVPRILPRESRLYTVAPTLNGFLQIAKLNTWSLKIL